MLTKVSRWALAVECALPQDLARGTPKAGVRLAWVVPTLAHIGAVDGQLLPATQFQTLVVDVQQANTAPQPDAN